MKMGRIASAESKAGVVNRSDDPCVILMFVFGAERKKA